MPLRKKRTQRSSNTNAIYRRKDPAAVKIYFHVELPDSIETKPAKFLEGSGIAGDLMEWLADIDFDKVVISSAPQALILSGPAPLLCLSGC